MVGPGDTKNASLVFSPLFTLPPSPPHLQVAFSLEGQQVARVSCGSTHTLLLMHNGAVYGCGDGGSGQLTQRTVQMDLPGGLVTLPVKLALPFGVQVRGDRGVQVRGGEGEGGVGGGRWSCIITPDMPIASPSSLDCNYPPPLPVQRTLSPHCQAPVVHDVVAGPGLTAFITRSPNELPEVHHMKLLQRWE